MYFLDEETEDARIYLYTDEVYENEGIATRLICRATQGVDKPTPTVTWSLDDEPITSQTAGYQVIHFSRQIFGQHFNPL